MEDEQRQKIAMMYHSEEGGGQGGGGEEEEEEDPLDAFMASVEVCVSCVWCMCGVCVHVHVYYANDECYHMLLRMRLRIRRRKLPRSLKPSKKK